MAYETKYHQIPLGLKTCKIVIEITPRPLFSITVVISCLIDSLISRECLSNGLRKPTIGEEGPKGVSLIQTMEQARDNLRRDISYNIYNGIFN